MEKQKKTRSKPPTREFYARFIGFTGDIYWGFLCFFSMELNGVYDDLMDIWWDLADKYTVFR